MRVCILKIIKMWELLLLLFVVSYVVVRMAESFAANNESRFRSPKTGEEEPSCCKGAFLSQLPTKPNGRLNFFTYELAVWVINCDD